MCVCMNVRVHVCKTERKREKETKREKGERKWSDWREVMRSVRPEEIQDTIGRKQGPFESDAVRRLAHFARLSLFFILLAPIKSRMNRDLAARDRLRILTYVSPITFYRYYCLACSRECSTIVVGIVQPQLLSFVRALLLSERRTRLSTLSCAQIVFHTNY